MLLNREANSSFAPVAKVQLEHYTRSTVEREEIPSRSPERPQLLRVRFADGGGVAAAAFGLAAGLDLAFTLGLGVALILAPADFSDFGMNGLAVGNDWGTIFH